MGSDNEDTVDSYGFSKDVKYDSSKVYYIKIRVNRYSCIFSTFNRYDCWISFLE